MEQASLGGVDPQLCEAIANLGRARRWRPETSLCR